MAYRLTPRDKQLHVKLPPLQGLGKKPIRSSIFPYPENVTTLIGKSGSGKTIAMYNMMEDHVKNTPLVERDPLVDKGSAVIPQLEFGIPQVDMTQFQLGFGISGGASSQEEKAKEKKRYHRRMEVFIFSPTLHSDEVMKSLINFLRKSGVKVMTKISTYDDAGKINLLAGLIEKIQKEDDLRDQQGEDAEEPYDKYIIIDDASEEIKKNPQVAALTKKASHIGGGLKNVIISTQDPKDLAPSSLNNVKNTLIFGKLPYERVKHLHDKMGIDIPEHLLQKIWQDATADKNGFLWVDNKSNKFYKNFTHEYSFG